jgi:hypothetical protein
VKSRLLSAVLFITATAASADIVEWKDAEGVRHYTNIEAEVPPAYRQSVLVVVNEQARPIPAAESTEAPGQQPVVAKADEPVRPAEGAHDWPPGTEAYLAGLERGLQLGRAVRAGGDVNIIGPLAVASAAGAGPGVGYFLPSPVVPLVTTSFDRGRSRHRTLRMLLQDQFAIDEEGPYVFDGQLGAAPLGVALNPFLPRGLPHGFVRNRRVMTR